MQNDLKRHLLGISFKVNNERILLYENDNIMYHLEAFYNIERKMNLQYKIPYLTRGMNNLEDMIYEHTSNNNIIFINFKYENNIMIVIYLPEILDEYDINYIANCLYNFKNIDVHLMKQKGELFYSEHKDKYLQNKTKNLTKDLHFTKKRLKFLFF